MKIRAPYALPSEKQSDLNYLIRLEWWNLGFRLSIVFVLFLVLGGSQAMKAAWLEDMLTLLPPIAFLIAMKVRKRDPDSDFPYGYHRVTNIAFLCSAVILALLGGYLLVDSGMKLIKAEHPSIGSVDLFGYTFWMGWLMVAGLTYSIIPPVIFGHLQEPAAKKVHEKTVFVDAKMSKADWMTGVAGIVGILGVGLGFWWADAAAGAVIGLDVSKDGVKNVKEAVGDLLDRRPRFTSKSEPEQLEEDLEEKLRAMAWVAEAAVRLREEGHVFSGEAFVVPTAGEVLPQWVAEAMDSLTDSDWRIYEVVIVVVPGISQGAVDTER
ncbi:MULTISPECIES: cation diffusion facilitator family transporter [Marinobacter]|uniref:cation diffusion facilitator family transporter n=1 Tax=Marinobacter TaxID=2742 RepID=UPI00124739EF|nr:MULTISPECIES: cation transporter [Marinobacter]MBL3556477.1 cation transporter [Marinobacter sp. JB05H06]